MGREADIAEVVADLVYTRMRDGDTFSIYDITQSIRTDLGQDVQHAGLCRPAGHAAARILCSVFQYGWQPKTYGQAIAREYAPTSKWTGAPIWEGATPPLATGRIATSVHITMIPIDYSELVHAIGYEPDMEILRVQLVSGNVYDYKDVPADVFARFVVAKSKGKYFNDYIKGKYF